MALRVLRRAQGKAKARVFWTAKRDGGWDLFARGLEGEKWSREMVCPRTDNILDNRPALLAKPTSGLLLIASADGRGALAGQMPQWLIRQLRKKGQKIAQRRPKSRWPDRVNKDLDDLGPDAKRPQSPDTQMLY